MPDDDFDDLMERMVEGPKARKQRSQQVRIPDLIHAGLITPPMDLEADYTPHENNPTGKTFPLTATIQRDGSLKVGDGVCNSVSEAASMAQQPYHTKPQSNEKLNVNGWVFWSFRDPNTGELRKIDELRAEIARRVYTKPAR